MEARILLTWMKISFSEPEVLEQLDLENPTRELEIFFRNFETRPSDSSYPSAF